MEHLGEVLPVDGYEVQLERSLAINFHKSLTHLYQPLIGIEAISLYLLLLEELEMQEMVHLQTHHTLMNYLNLPLDRIYIARRKLEAIGLLKTLKREENEKVKYTYVLRAPFTPLQFFQDMMLSELLYRQIGASKFAQLQSYYYKAQPYQNGEEVTAKFHDVFQTFQPTATMPEEKQLETKVEGIALEEIDFVYLTQALKRKMIPVEKVLTEHNKKLISQLVHLYGLEQYEIENALNWALTEEYTLDVEEFKAACDDLFQNKYNVSKVKLEPKESVEIKKTAVQTNVTKEERLVQTLETISPKQLLEDLSGGKNASEQDIKLIGDIMLKQGIPAPVMNVLIHYVLLQSDMQLSKAYLEKIASHWSRLDLKTAKEAMKFAKKQTEKAQTPRNNRNYRKKSVEVIPDWFKQNQDNKKSEKETEIKTNDTNKQTDTLDAEEQAELMALLQRHASHND